MPNKKIKTTIGNQEWFAFPELGIPCVKARVDSGAKTSSLHAFNIRGFEREGEPWVQFDVHPIQHNRRIVIHCEHKAVDKRMVKSSSGLAETRYVIRTPVKLGNENWEIELTLANRDSMGFRMLLGREAMNGRLLVDPSIDFAFGDSNSDTIKKHYQQDSQETTSTSTQLKIGLLATNEELYSNRRLLQAGRERGHSMEFLNLKQCYIKLDASEPEAHYRGGQLLNDLDAVITRIRPSAAFYGTALARQFESMGIYTSNSSSAISQARDKLFALQLLLKSGIPIPSTGFANEPVDTKDLISMVGAAPLIVKLLEGAQGRGYVLAETQQAAESVINAFRSLSTSLLVQKFIKEAKGKDIRCFVINGKVVAAIERSAAPGEFSTDIRLGGTAKVVKIKKQERELAVKAAKVFGLTIAGVDIIRSKQGPLVLDVSSSPELESIETTTGKDIAGLIIESLEKKLQGHENG